ncbi:hypothetical protein Tco_1136750 [Tanacetum coccineum]
MTTLKFADTHNMVAFLAKPAESEGFEQIVDFLNAHTIKYALTINPTIYTSCIEQFWATVKAKTVNGEVQLQALVDGKKIIITESIVRRDLQLEDAEGVDCLPNATIFEQLTLMGSMIGSLMYLTSSRPDIMFVVCACARYQVNPKVSHLHAVKMIFRHNLLLLLEVNAARHNLLLLLKVNAARHKLKIAEDADGVDCLPNATIFEQLTLMGSKTTAWNEFSSTMASAIIYLVTNQKFNFSKYIFESMVKNLDNMSGIFLMYPRGNTLRSGKDRLKLEELMALCTTLQSRVLALETTKTTQATEITSLKKRVKKLEKRNKSRTHGLKRLYRVGSSKRVESSKDKGLGEEDASKQGRIADIDAHEDIYLVNVQTDEDMFGVNELDGDEVIVESVDVVKTTEETRSVVTEVTAITIPVKLKSAKPKATTITTTPTLTTTTAAITITTISTRPRAKGLVIHEQEQAPTPTVSSQQPLQVKVQDKGKRKMVEPEPVKKMSKKEILRLDEELTFKLQADEEEEERLAIEKAQ